MRILTGDECGLLKEIIPELSRCSDSAGIVQPASDEGVSRLDHDGYDNGKSSPGIMSRSRGLVGMTFVPCHDGDDIAYSALRVDGSMERWQGSIPEEAGKSGSSKSAGRYQMTHSWKNIFATKEKTVDDTKHTPIVGRTTAIAGSKSSSSNPKNVLACCTSMGRISIMDMFHLEKGVVAQYDAFKVNGNNDRITVTKGNFQNRDIATSMAIDPADSSRIAIGGRERETILLDIETGKNLWKAKNLPRDPQTLLEKPVWSTAIEFLSMDNSDSSNSNLLVVGTAYKELRIYDVRANSIQRRPILFTSDKDKERIVEHRITAVCPLSKYHSVIIGDAAGYMCSVDLRNIQHGVKGRYNGPAGSIRQIVQHESLPIVACVGLDRMLRTFDTQKRKMLDCVYLKQRLNCMLFCSDTTWGSSDGSSSNSNGEQIDSTAEIVDGEGSINDEDDVQDYVNSDDETESGSSDENSLSGESDSDSDSSEVVERHVGLKHSKTNKKAPRNSKKRRS